MAESQGTPADELLQAKRKARADYMREYRKKNPKKYKAIEAVKWRKAKTKDPKKYAAQLAARQKRYHERQKLKKKTPEQIAKKKAERHASYLRWKAKGGDRVRLARAAAVRRYYARHPEKCKALAYKRRAKTEDGTVTAKEWKAIKAKYNNACAYCKRAVRLEMDHVIALSKGGPHRPDNVVPACRHCNSSKGNGVAPKSPPT